MSKNVSELCVLLMRDMYGDVSARVVDLLLRYGRSALPPLVRRVKLPDRIVKQNLVVLIQQHLVLHYTDPETEVVFYECNWRQVYELLHVGRIVRATQERFGEDGASVVSNFLLLGHAKVSDFTAAYGFSTRAKIMKPPPTLPNGTNGVSTTSADVVSTGGPINSIARLKQVIVQLLKEKYLVKVLETDMQSETDVYNVLKRQYGEEVNLSGTTTTKIALEKEISRRISDHVDRQEDDRMAVHAGLKRKSGFAHGRPVKRQRMMNDDGDDDAYGEDNWELDDNMILRLNHDKFLMIFRNAQIVKCVESRISRATSLVIAEMLKILESRQFGCKALGPRGSKNLTVTTFEINKTLNPDLNLNKAIAYAEAEAWAENQNKGNKKRPLSNGLNGSLTNGNGHAGTDGDDDDNEDDEEEDIKSEEEDDADSPEAKERRKRLYQIKDHMQLLTNDAMKFVKNVSNRSFGEWEIDYGPVMEGIRRLEMENIVEDSLGSIAVRLVRILRDKGKLDEKQLANISLLKHQDIRQHLSKLHERGYVEIQEVPRSSDRTPSRTIYLFYYDNERAKGKLMENIYKGMSRLLERVGRERHRHDVLLEKAERTDVVGNEDELLTTAEKKEMEGWKNMQEKLLGQLFRLDSQIMLFRDW